MKTLTKTLLYVCGLSLVPLALNAANEQASLPNEYQLPLFQVEDIAVLPEPSYTPIPPISSVKAGTEIKLKFTVNKRGRPVGVNFVQPLFSYRSADVRDFACGVRNMVSDWKFEPALTANGEAIAVKVILPVQVIKKADGRTLEAIATLILDDGTSDRS